MNIKPIETHYKGYRFRSRLEARWAVFFDTLGLKWEYEKEGFDLGGTYYLPDFWLPQVRTWAEVKGEEFTEDQKTLCYRLAKRSRGDVLMLAGTPDYKAYPLYSFEDPTGYTLDPSVYDGTYVVETDCYVTTEYIGEHRFYVNTGENEREQRHLLEGDDAYDEAVKAARSARFEHGEKGASFVSEAQGYAQRFGIPLGQARQELSAYYTGKHRNRARDAVPVCSQCRREIDHLFAPCRFCSPINGAQN